KNSAPPTTSNFLPRARFPSRADLRRARRMGLIAATFPGRARLDICAPPANLPLLLAMKIPLSLAPVRRRLGRSLIRAFTMMELLVVLAILGLLAALAISNVT